MTDAMPDVAITAEAPPGTHASSPWSLPRAAWVQVVKRVYVMIGFHELGLLAAGLAFFVFLALTPLIAATVMIYGLIGDPAGVQAQMEAIVRVVPADAARLIEEQLLQIVTTSTGVTGFALLIALFFAVYGGMRAASGMISALNIINEEHETRSFVKLTLRAAGLTMAAVLIALTGLLSGGVFAWLQTQTGVFLGGATALLFKLLTWAAAVALGTCGFALIMRYGPDRRPAKWRWLTPGSLLATVLWILVSFGFSLYVAYISDYNATYGSLSAIVVFLMWLFLSAYGVLLGALLNAEIERQTNCDTTIGPARPPGERGAVLADQIEERAPSLEALEKRKRRHAEHVRRKAERAAGSPEPA
ncbi:YhjD/YihY/BrkB family envelope integrity protein [Novosphingobium sp. 9U]|uniref:YhjD/YihY/BrkB family envelope integrity protein n=1 Tax=Novosphingobium sp. 9U TaxID=2653158 RepID=UPI0012F2C863|nr:YhjD/YihY/BrkB family envelope integrity protein [Novosphingobium sp. 9U]VWX51436.1 Ribonuclease BN [Novosphingobium sp. 9U]